MKKVIPLRTANTSSSNAYPANMLFVVEMDFHVHFETGFRCEIFRANFALMLALDRIGMRLIVGQA